MSVVNISKSSDNNKSQTYSREPAEKDESKSGNTNNRTDDIIIVQKPPATIEDEDVCSSSSSDLSEKFCENILGKPSMYKRHIKKNCVHRKKTEANEAIAAEKDNHHNHDPTSDVIALNMTGKSKLPVSDDLFYIHKSTSISDDFVGACCIDCTNRLVNTDQVDFINDSDTNSKNNKGCSCCSSEKMLNQDRIYCRYCLDDCAATTAKSTTNCTMPPKSCLRKKCHFAIPSTTSSVADSTECNSSDIHGDDDDRNFVKTKNSKQSIHRRNKSNHHHHHNQRFDYTNNHHQSMIDTDHRFNNIRMSSPSRGVSCDCGDCCRHHHYQHNNNLMIEQWHDDDYYDESSLMLTASGSLRSSLLGDEDDDDETMNSEYTIFNTNNYYDLPYQNNNDYLKLVEELEEKLVARNKDRVKKTIKEFECRSRQNKNLDKPIFEYDDGNNGVDNEDMILQNLISSKPSVDHNHHHHHHHNHNYHQQQQQQQQQIRCNLMMGQQQPIKNRGSIRACNKNAKMKNHHNMLMPPVAAATKCVINTTDVRTTSNDFVTCGLYSDNEDGLQQQQQPQKYTKFQRILTKSHWQMNPESGEWIKDNSLKEYNERRVPYCCDKKNRSNGCKICM